MNEIQTQLDTLIMRRALAVIDRDYKRVRAIDLEIQALKLWQSNLLIDQLWPGALVIESMDLS